MTKKFVIAVLPFVLLGYLVMEEFNSVTIKKVSVKADELSMLSSEVESIENSIELGPKIDNWMTFKNFAEANGATVEWVKDGFYDGEYDYYSGIITGNSKYAIAIVGELQSEIPIILHSINILGKTAQIKVSVLGVDQ